MVLQNFLHTKLKRYASINTKKNFKYVILLEKTNFHHHLKIVYIQYCFVLQIACLKFFFYSKRYRHVFNNDS